MGDSTNAVPLTMAAWTYSTYGGGPAALVLKKDVPVPKPGKQQVLVKVQASSVNPFDIKVQAGELRPIKPSHLPFIPGLDLTGEVVAVGPEVSQFKIGDVVFGFDGNRNSALAEYAILEASQAALRPPELTPEVAAALPTVGETALQALRDCCGVTLPGSKEWTGEGSYKGHVLVIAGSGGVGHIAVQLAKYAGAYVTTTVGKRNLDFAKTTLKADEAVDYTTPEGKALTPPSGKPYDAVIGGPNPIPYSTIAPNMAPKSVLLRCVPGPAAFLEKLWYTVTMAGKRTDVVMVNSNGKDLEIVGGLVAQGKVTVVIDSVFEFEKAPEAWAKCIEAHNTGKIVIKH